MSTLWKINCQEQENLTVPKLFFFHVIHEQSLNPFAEEKLSHEKTEIRSGKRSEKLF